MTNKILLHSCCAHCTAYPVNYWRSQGYEVSALWYNPNIHPFTEHQHRREATQALSRELNFQLLDNGSYDFSAYFHRVTGNEDDRCRYCFQLRLEHTADIAKQNGFTAFTTTLLISPHQKHDLIREVGEAVAVARGVEFLYADLRKRYSDSRHITKPMDIYRQRYCGCIYSKWESVSDQLKE